MTLITSDHTVGVLDAEGALRLGLIAYRDHPPQDHVYIVKNCMCAVLTVKLALPLLCYK